MSAELKMARSLVRLAEIQATLQEQRILFLRQQMLDMERHTTPSSASIVASGGGSATTSGVAVNSGGVSSGGSSVDLLHPLHLNQLDTHVVNNSLHLPDSTDHR